MHVFDAATILLPELVSHAYIKALCMACRSSGHSASRHWLTIQTGVLVHHHCCVLVICTGTASAPSMHPCRHAGHTPAEKDQAELAFRRASEAYEVLSNGEHDFLCSLQYKGHCNSQYGQAGRSVNMQSSCIACTVRDVPARQAVAL